ncbi:hypothetical protein BBP40_008187 [Aspergillus hancockii]|nr:hypothetical protein BBP40_008187 [Aspergillus hancockii]
MKAACVQCRVRKVRCDATVPRLTSAPSFPSDDVVRSLLRQYFDRLYPLPSFNFLHQDTVIRRCSEKTIDESLKLAICAITALFFDIYKSEHISWAQESERLILDRLERPSIFQIQASLLTIRYRAGVGQFPRAFILAGLAARWAVSLRLNYEHSSLGPIAQEVRRRTFWSLYLLEDSFCVGLKEFELFDPETIHLQLPCEDEDFNDERPVLTGFLQPGKGLEPELLGPRGAFVKLAFIRRGIMSGYPESTPHAAVDRMRAPERALMKDRCLGHAERIVKVLSDFVHHKDERHMLEFDAAVCAYHAARLILFGTYTGRDNTGLPMQMAINKAQLCLDVITRYFEFSAQLRSMRQMLERAIQQHKKWLESSDHRAVATADPSPHPPLGISRDAYMRQRLAIHSLLRQSDFVDDSREAAPEPAATDAVNWTASTEDEQMQEPPTDWGIQDVVYPLTDPTISDSNLLLGLPYGLDLNGWPGDGGEQTSGYIGGFEEQYMY